MFRFYREKKKATFVLKCTFYKDVAGFQVKEKIIQFKQVTFVFHKHQAFSQYTSQTRISWELVRNGNSWAPHTGPTKSKTGTGAKQCVF